jgi:hypothetical protein
MHSDKIDGCWVKVEQDKHTDEHSEHKLQEKKIIESMIHFLAYQGHANEMECIFNLGVRDYGLNDSNNQLLSLRRDLTSAAGLLTSVVIIIDISIY